MDEAEDALGTTSKLSVVPMDKSDDEELDSLHVNEEYAKRFQHNKAREERQKLEEKYGSDGEESSSSSEEEDDEGWLATSQVDQQIRATLDALRRKDPKVYDPQVTFFQENEDAPTKLEKKQKPMYLKDYHRETLLAQGSTSRGEPTYVEQQADLKDSVVRALHQATEGEDDELLIARPAEERPVDQVPLDDESFLDSYVTSNKWRQVDHVPTYHEMVDEDEEFEERAEAFEDEFNSRFEVQGHARDITSVRREESDISTSRQRNREKKVERRRQEREKLLKLVEQDKAERLVQVQKASGMDHAESWAKEDLSSDFDEEKHEQLMQQRFDDTWYGQRDKEIPTWADDIDIPQLDEEMTLARPIKRGRKARRKQLEEKNEKKTERKGQVQDSGDEDSDDFQGPFKYRDVSPETFGLTETDILLAQDSQLNEFAGLKKLAPYRASDKKAKDRRKLRKKRRLQEWREKVFGKEEATPKKKRRGR